MNEWRPVAVGVLAEENEKGLEGYFFWACVVEERGEERRIRKVRKYREWQGAWEKASLGLPESLDGLPTLPKLSVE